MNPSQQSQLSPAVTLEELLTPDAAGKDHRSEVSADHSLQDPLHKQPFPPQQKQRTTEPPKAGLKPITTHVRPEQSVSTDSATSSNDPTRPKARAHGQSVSFCESDGQDKARRFTISAYPSANNVTTTGNGQTESLPPSRKASLRSGVRDNEMLSFAVTSKLASHLKQLNTSDASSQGNSSRVSSPILPSKDAQVPAQQSPANRRIVSQENKTPVIREDLGQIQPPSKSSTPSTPQPIKQTKKSNKTVVASPVGPPVPFQQFLSKEDDGKFHILLACTGSVATLKMPLIIDKLFQIFGTSKISIQLILTKSSGHFLKGLKIHNDVKIWRDDDEWANFNYHQAQSATTLSPYPQVPPQGTKKHHKNPYEKLILHNELRRWADIMLIAPLSANTLAKILNGIADNLLTSIVRAWGPSATIANHATVDGVQASTTVVKKPILVAPAMNTFMYTHPITAKQLAMLTLNEDGLGIEVLKPVEKVLVCGDIGMGGMREWSDIVDILRRRINAMTAERNGNMDDGADEDEEDEEDEDDDEANEGDDDEDDDDDDDDDDEDDEDDDDEDDEDGQNEEVTADNENSDLPNDNEADKDADDMIFDITEDEADGETVADVKKTYNYDYEKTE